MADEEAEESGGGGIKKLIIIAAALILLIVIGVILYFVFKTDSKDEKAMGSEPKSKMEAEIQAKSQKENIRLTNPHYSPKKNYTVNLKDGKHFLQIELVAAMEDEKALEYLVKREPEVDDTIISFLQELTTEDLRHSSGMDLLKRELFKKLNGIFSQEFIEDSDSGDRTPIKKVLITKFILN
ncbi:MAG: flagellar basal body-associated FliL family protein [Deltaproteobacteria bacterium]|nr:flagellar basal body-associated FliL family protein [Deltaproteobacteria bacterium]